MIRTAKKEDLEAINYIYNQAIYAGFCTGHLHPRNEQDLHKWFNEHDPTEYPIFVFENDHKILGWASISHYRKGREALRETGELRYFVDFKYHGQDIGSRLVEHCIDQCSSLNKRILLAVIIEGNVASIGLLEKYGFEEWGFMPKVLKYDGEIRGQYYMGKVLD